MLPIGTSRHITSTRPIAVSSRTAFHTGGRRRVHSQSRAVPTTMAMAAMEKML